MSKSKRKIWPDPAANTKLILRPSRITKRDAYGRILSVKTIPGGYERVHHSTRGIRIQRQ